MVIQLLYDIRVELVEHLFELISYWLLYLVGYLDLYSLRKDAQSTIDLSFHEYVTICRVKVL